MRMKHPEHRSKSRRFAMEKRNSTILIQVSVQTARHCIERLLRSLVPGINGNRSHSDQHTDELQHLYPLRKASLPPQPTPVLPFSNESSDFYSIVELMRSKWLAADENNRLDYLERFKQTCDKYLQSIRTQHLSAGHDTQFHQVLHSFLTAILDLLYYLTSSNLDLSIRIKLVLSTCLGWLIKHAQVIYCKRNYKTICTVFKNILLHGQSNNRQLAVSAVYFLSKAKGDDQSVSRCSVSKHDDSTTNITAASVRSDSLQTDEQCFQGDRNQLTVHSLFSRGCLFWFSNVLDSQPIAIKDRAEDSLIAFLSVTRMTIFCSFP